MTGLCRLHEYAPTLAGTAHVMEDIRDMLRGLSIEVREQAEDGRQPLPDPIAGQTNVTTCHAVQTTLGRLVWTDHRGRDEDAAANRIASSATVRLVRNGSIVLSVRMPLRLPRSVVEVEDLSSFADLLAEIAVMIGAGEWGSVVEDPDPHALAAAYGLCGRRSVLRWPNHWTPAFIDENGRGALSDGTGDGSVPDGWENFASALTPAIDLCAAIDENTGLRTLSISQRTGIIENVDAVVAMRALILHVEKKA
jgi:hypothetical protein